MLTGALDDLDFTVDYIQDERVLAAAGTEDRKIAQFMEDMRTGQPVRASDLQEVSHSR